MPITTCSYLLERLPKLKNKDTIDTEIKILPVDISRICGEYARKY
jgi:hypothetical protein